MTRTALDSADLTLHASTAPPSLAVSENRGEKRNVTSRSNCLEYQYKYEPNRLTSKCREIHET